MMHVSLIYALTYNFTSEREYTLVVSNISTCSIVHFPMKLISHKCINYIIQQLVEYNLLEL
jgi:hypothetical protein